MVFIWLAMALIFSQYLFDPNMPLASQIDAFPFLSFTGSILLISLPPLFHVKYLKRRAYEETIRLHSLMRERNNIIFWQAQTEEMKAKLAPELLRYMSTKSTADMSLEMILQRGFRRKNSKEETDLSDGLFDIAKAIKDISPLKPD